GAVFQLVQAENGFTPGQGGDDIVLVAGPLLRPDAGRLRLDGDGERRAGGRPHHEVAGLPVAAVLEILLDDRRGDRKVNRSALPREPRCVLHHLPTNSFASPVASRGPGGSALRVSDGTRGTGASAAGLFTR